MALDLDVKIRSCTVATCRARVGRETKMGDGDWVLRKRRRRMDEQVWSVLYVQVTMYIISDWTGLGKWAKPSF